MALGVEELGIYISVPFCRAKCSFCNFASDVGSGAAVEGYLEQLVTEIAGVRGAAEAAGWPLPERVNTLYFGGGTPSLLEPGQLRRIFAALRGTFDLAQGAEITLEAAPRQIGDELLEAALALGVNRVSLGVQSLVDREAQTVGRSHTERSCQEEFRRLRAAGVHNLGADLIAGLPYQTEASWQRSVEIAAESALTHLSVYMLEVDEDSRLGREVLGGGARLHAPAVPSDELVAALYEQACGYLPKFGFEQYEISNFARHGMRSRHNFKYWLREPYLGFGLDAHSMLVDAAGGTLRWANAETLADYDGEPRLGKAVALSRREIFEETIFLGLRLTDGLAMRALETFPAAWVEELRHAAFALEQGGLLEAQNDRLRLTGAGRLLSSDVFGELLLPALV